MKKLLNIVIIFQIFAVILGAGFIASNFVDTKKASAHSRTIFDNFPDFVTKETVTESPKFLQDLETAYGLSLLKTNIALKEQTQTSLVAATEIETEKPETQAPTQVASQPSQATSQPVTPQAPIAGPEVIPAQPTQPQEQTIQASHVVIPSVGINAPVQWNVNGLKMDEYLPVLSRGSAHFKGTPLPGQGGSTLIFGHSSYDIALPNNNDKIFRSLHNIGIGDTVYVEYAGSVYRYEVYQTKVIVPTDPEFVSQDGPERIMLMTCTPIGSTKNRLLVYAKRIY